MARVFNSRVESEIVGSMSDDSRNLLSRRVLRVPPTISSVLYRMTVRPSVFQLDQSID